jgi:hypothetical protein
MTGLPVLLHRHFSPFRMYVDRATRTVVVLNPKVASRNVRFILSSALKEVRGLSDPSAGRYSLFRNAREFPFAPVRDYIDALRHPDRYAFYCFVRNPYSRLKSAWVDKIVFGEGERVKRTARSQVPSIRRFAAGRRLTGSEPDTPIPFESFLDFVESQPDGHRDKHWDLQSEVLFLDTFRYERIFRIETEFCEGMTTVLIRLGATEELATTLAATRRGEGPRYAAAVYDAEIADRAKSIYARDFERLDYQTDCWAGL